jgi:hypothetical protein
MSERTRAIIACSVLEDEVMHLLEREGRKESTPTRFLDMAQHDQPTKLSQNLQAEIDDLEKREPALETITLVYGYCSGGIANLHAQRCALIFPRVHDCMALFLGSPERYMELLKENPARYWYTPGWIRGKLPPGPDRFEHLKKQYAEQFDEDNAEFLVEQETLMWKHHDTATYVDLDISKDREQSLEYTRKCADWLGWKTDVQQGSTQYLEALLTGPWDDTERYLVVEPGQQVRQAHDEKIITTCPLMGEQKS